MFLLGKLLGKKPINFRRTLIILVVCMLSSTAASFVTHYFTLRACNKTIAKITPTLDEAIKKPTISNNIENSVNTGKIKKSDGVTLVLTPDNDQKPVNVISNETDCVPLDSLMTILSKREIRKLKRKGYIE